VHWTEILGYAASALVAVSLTMGSLVKLRVINLAGAVLFAVYGALLGVWPVLLVNGFIAVVNVVFLVQLLNRRPDYFQLMPMRDRDNPFLRRFLEFHAPDVRRFFPGFDLDRLQNPTIVFVLRNMVPVGVLVCSPDTPGTLRIHLDYVLPPWRDLRCARYFYREWGPVLAENGFRRFVAHTEAGLHRNYLRRMGYRPDGERGEGWYSRPVLGS